MLHIKGLVGGNRWDTLGPARGAGEAGHEAAAGYSAAVIIGPSMRR